MLLTFANISVGKETVLVLVLIVCSNLCMASEIAYAKFNETISLTCTLNSNLAAIEWYHQKIGFTQDRTVYLNEIMYSVYKERFSVSCNERTCELKISRVNSADAGKYTCKNNEATKFIELIVFEVYPSNKSCSVPEKYNKTIIGKNACNIALATVPISCKMKYYGNKIPEMEWTDDYTKKTLDSKKYETNDVIYSTVQVIAESTTKITCTIKFSVPNITSNRPIYWTKDVKVEDLFNNSTKDKTNCSSGDQICQIREHCDQSQWTFPNGTSISSSETLVLKDLESGDYECNNVCVIRGLNCVIRQRAISHFYSTDRGSTTETPHTANILAIVFGCIFGFLVLVGMSVAAVFFIRRAICKRKQLRKYDDKTEEGNDEPLTTNASPNKNETRDCVDAQ